MNDEFNNHQEEAEYESAVFFKIRSPKFLSDEHKRNFENSVQQMLNDVVNAGNELTLESWDRFDKFHTLPKNQQESALRKANRIPVFRTGNITKRFTNTLNQKLINLLYADLVGKPLRLSRNKDQWCSGGRFAKFKMDYDEFFSIDDILCILGIAEQYIPDDGWKDEEILETRIWLTNYGKSLFADCHNSIVNYIESNKEFKEVVMTKPIKKMVKNKKTGEKRLKNFSIPVDYYISDYVSRIINRVKRINSINEKNRLTVRCKDIELTYNETNKLLTQHIDGKIKISRLVYSLSNSNSNTSLLNTGVIEVINKGLCGSGSKEKDILQEGDTNSLVEAGAGIEGRSIVLCQYNKEIACQTDSTNIIINTIEFEILDKRIHRVFSRESWSCHGRHYSFWTSMKKIFRSGVYSNDSTVPMVGLDFSAMHQIFAYSLSKERLPCDASSIYVVDGFDKQLIKDIALVAMNVKRSKGKRPYQGALQSIKNNICEDGTITYEHAKAAFYAFIDKHKAIENYICSDFGIKGMFYDSQIMDDCLYELMIKKGIIIYPVHDELLCPADPDIVKVVLDQMEKSYCKVIKYALVQSGKLKENEPLPEWIKPSIKQD